MCVGGGYFQGEGQEKILLCKGSHYMKNKNIGGMCFINSTRSAKKAPMQKCAKNTKFVFLEQLTAMPQFNMQNVLLFFFFFFFLSSRHDTNPLLHLSFIFVKNIIIYWLILTMNHQGSYFLFFFFFCLHPVGQTFLYPSKFCNHLKHSAK